MTDQITVLLTPENKWVRTADPDVEPKKYADAIKQMGKEAEIGWSIKTISMAEFETLKHFKQP